MSSSTVQAVVGPAVDRVLDLGPPGGVVGLLIDDDLGLAAGGVADLEGTPVRTTTSFDLASVTKVAATISGLLRLVSHGLLAWDDPVARYVARSGCHPATTVRDLAWHRAGLWEWQPLYLAENPVVVRRDLPLRYPPGQERHYSDLGFMVLGEILAAASGMPLEEAVQELVAAPLGLASFRFGGDPECAASARGDDAERRMVATGEPYPIVVEVTRAHAWRESEIRGEANDGNCRHVFAGVSGHAGLFATAADLLRLAGSLAQNEPEEAWHGSNLVDLVRDGPDPGQAMGWRSTEVTWRDRATRLLWHTGFTGTAIGFIPGAGVAIALLTNRLLANEPVTSCELWRSTLQEIPDLSITEGFR